jgi:hypothetical protein
MLCIVVGDLGSGKTLLLTYIASHTPDCPILANYTLKIPNYQKLEPETLLDANLGKGKKLILMTEAYTWLESRTSGKGTNLYLSYVLFQSRKRGLDFYLDAQLGSTIDVRFREMANIVILCEKVKEGFRYDIIKRSYTNPVRMAQLLTFAKAEKYYPMYDTTELTLPSNMQELSMEFLFNDPQKLNILIEEAIIKIGDIGKITKERVEIAITQKGYPQKLARYVYMKLKQGTEQVKQ